jgi:dTDP-4-amino-4,6-dideoxygalactose transaminase
MTIPVLDLGPEIEALWPELQEAIAKVLRSGQFIMGPEVKKFEEEVAEYLGVPYAIGLNSGTDALFIALKALGIGPGDEVITTPFTFFATAEAISHVGATPVFVDIDPVTFNLDPTRLETVITSRTRAIIPVHLFGQACEMDVINATAAAHGLQVIEDVAQAFGGEYKGKKLGTIGAIGTFSFFPSKNLGAFGDGGLLVTHDAKIAQTARMLRSHGSMKKYHNEIVGYNSRLDELQAAILRVKLPYIEQSNGGRRAVAELYDQLLSDVPGVITPTATFGTRHVYHQYTIRLEGGRRDRVQRLLAEAGVGTMVYYPVPVHRLPVYYGQFGSIPQAEKAASEVLSLPIWPQMDQQKQRFIVHELSRYCL